MNKPPSIKPMLATLIDDPFDGDDWSFEMKLDGYRIIAHLQKGKVKLHSRNLKDYTEKFYIVSDALKSWNVDAIVDGEVVVLNDDGVSMFNSLQNWKSDEDGPLSFYVFDLLWHNGKDLTKLPLHKRRAQLQKIIPKSDIIRYSGDIVGQGTAFFKLVTERGLEGMIAKKRSSIYLPGERSSDWLKVKTAKHEDVIICGYTRNENSGNLFSSLVVGAYKGKYLVFIGQVGSGFSLNMQRDIMRRIKPIIRKTSPFKETPDLNKGGRWRRAKPEVIVWCRPSLVCEIQYLEKTVGGDLRHQSFRGMRDDKNPKECKV